MSEFIDRISEMLRGAVESERPPAPVADPMADISSGLLKTLQERSARNRGQDLGLGLASAFGIAPQYAAATKAEDDSSLQNEKLMYDLMKSERDFAATQGQNKQKNTLDLLKLAVERGDKDAKAVSDALNQFVPDMADRHVVANELAAMQESIGAGNAGVVVPQTVQRLIAEKKIKASRSASGTSQSERMIDELVDSGTITPEQGLELKEQLVRTQAQGGQGVTERQLKRLNELTAKKAQGLTPEEQLELNNLAVARSRYLTVPDRGVVQIGPQTTMPGPVAAGGGVGGPQAQAGGPSVVMPAMPKPLPKDAQDDFEAAYGMEKAIEDMEAGLSTTGRIRGNVAKVETWFGDNPKAIKFKTAQQNLKVAAQAIIKGIPSNFDVETFIDTLAELGQPETVNRARMDFTKGALRRLVETKIAYYKGLNYQVPDFAYRLASRLGIDPDSLQPMTREQASRSLDSVQTMVERFRESGPDDKPSAGSRLIRDPKTGELRPK